MDKYTILKDTQEKPGWFFYPDQICAGMKDQHLKTGDYTLEGFEHLLCIERKKTTAVVSQNITTQRFQNEIDRMIKLKYKYIICEFDMYQLSMFPRESGLPEHIIKKIKMNSNYIKAKLNSYKDLGIQVILAGNKFDAMLVAKNIFKEVFEREHGRKNSSS